ncbi:MAG TPA: redox-sensing transcriptional repressor Rex [Anaerolineaceae bacterium]
MDDKIPDIVVGRLPKYLQALLYLQETGKQTTSSQELGVKVGISAAQIRKDLSLFGEFGKQGTGYSIAFLIDQLQKILHADRVWGVALVGAGDLGHAIARYAGFSNRGFRIVMVFDNDPAKIGARVGEHTVQDVKDIESKIRAAGVTIAMLTVPASAAQNAADALVRGGIRAILNYAPITLSVPETVRVEAIDPIQQLQHMTYYLE